MAVQTQTPFKEYVANGVTTVFPLEFNCDNSEYLIVSLDGEEAPVGSWSLINDTVSFNTPPVNGVAVTLERNTPYQRTTDYQSYNNSFRPSPVNKDFDLIWWKLQELGFRDQVIWLALVKEIADRISGDNDLQNQINTIDEWLTNLQQNVNENTNDIAQLVNDLSKEIADRIANDEALKEMFLSMMDEAINEGTINALAITHVDSLEALEEIANVWNGRTVYVKDLGNYKYDALTTSWTKVYQDAENLKYGSTNQKQVNDELLGDNGAGVVNLSFSEIADSVKKSLYNIVYDQIIDVTWFGANGNWNMGNQSGFDSTQAVANAIGFYSTLGTRRQGGRRAIKFPYGNFKLSSILIPASIEFGLDFIGEGLHSTFLWFDHQNTSPAIDCQVEFTQFKDMTLMGSLSDQNGGDSSKWKQVGFKGKLATNYPDVDVKLNNCGLFFFQDLTQIYGRGCIIENCIAGFITNVMNIVCSPDTVFVTNADTNSSKTGMRHYTIRNTRFDVCSNIYKITGTSSSIDYINGILFVGNDLLYCDKIIDAPDATIRRGLIANNTALMSFASGIVRCKASKSCSMSFNNWSKGYDDTVAPVSAAKGIEYLWLSSGKSENLTIAGNHVKNLTSTPINIGPSSASVKVLNNDFDEAWTFSSSPNHYVVFSSADIAGLIVEGNTFNSSNVSGTYRLANHSVQNHKNTRFGINQAPWAWQDSRCSFVPKLKVNGIDSATAATATHGRYYIDQNYVYVEVILVINPAETTGDLGFSLPPISAVAENSTISTQYSGAGTLHKVTGFTLAGYNLSSIVVNPSNQIAELWRQKDLVQSRLTAADKSGTISLYATFKYRY